MAPRPHLGPRFRFCPTDEEIIECFLKPKVVGGGFIHEMDIYSAEPWNLGVAFEFGQGKNEAFFLTSRHPSSRSGNGRRAKRSIGAGYWHIESGETEILLGELVVGCKTTLTFKNHDGRKWPDNQWIMHEYCLCCDHGGSSCFQPMAFYRIYKKTTKGGGGGGRTGRGAPLHDDDDGDEPMMSQKEMMAELFQDDQ